MIKHTSATASHYDQEAEHYDAFNAAKSVALNALLARLLKQYNIHTILDLTCGTGSQVFYLQQQGFNICGVDINEKMLSIAKHKAEQDKLVIDFKTGDMRHSQVGQFDAVITMFNAIGHLDRHDFANKALLNIRNNLKPGGLYIFDNFNHEYLQHQDNITKLTMDNQIVSDNCIAREIQYSTISTDGILASYDIYHQQTHNNEPHISQAFQTLQTYNINTLKMILLDQGFKIIELLAADGLPFDNINSERMLIVAARN